MTPLSERIEAWINHANALGIKLTRILLHPDDGAEYRKLKAAGSITSDLPVEFL